MDQITQFFDGVDFIFYIKFIIAYLVIIWIAIVIWVLQDIRVRTNNIILQLFCLLVGFIPFIGIFLYIIIRPGRSLYEKYYDEIEENLRMMEGMLADKKENKTYTQMKQEMYKKTEKIAKKKNETKKEEEQTTQKPKKNKRVKTNIKKKSF